MGLPGRCVHSAPTMSSSFCLILPIRFTACCCRGWSMHFLPMINSHCCVFQTARKRKRSNISKWPEPTRSTVSSVLRSVMWRNIWMIRWHLCRLSVVFQKISRVYPEIIIWADVWQQRIWFGEVRRICCLCRPLCQWTMRCESADLALKGIVKKTRFHMQALRFPRSRYRPCTHPFLHAA